MATLFYDDRQPNNAQKTHVTYTVCWSFKHVDFLLLIMNDRGVLIVRQKVNFSSFMWIIFLLCFKVIAHPGQGTSVSAPDKPMDAYDQTTEPAVFLQQWVQKNTGAKNNLLVFLDIDDTIFTVLPSVPCAHPLLFKTLSQDVLKKHKNFSKEDVVRYVTPAFLAIYDLCPIQLIDKKLPEVLSFLEDNNIVVIALTARDPLAAKMTLDQLSRLGIKMKVFMSDGCLLSLPSGTVMVHDGVVFSGVVSKGKTITKIIENFWSCNLGKNCVPQNVMLIDDRISHLQSSVEHFSQFKQHINFFPVLCTEMHYADALYSESASKEDFYLSLHANKDKETIRQLIATDPFVQAFIRNEQALSEKVKNVCAELISMLPVKK